MNGTTEIIPIFKDIATSLDLSFTLSGNRMTSITDAGSPGGTFSFTYDALGNLTNDGRKGFVIY